jgi:thioredoxin reductase (NADPH)
MSVVVGRRDRRSRAAWYCSRRGMPTALLEAEGLLGGQVATVNALDDWPATGEDLGRRACGSRWLRKSRTIMRSRSRTNRCGIGASGARLLFTLEKTVRRTLRARRLIAAAGAKLRTLESTRCRGAAGKGVSQCAHCDGLVLPRTGRCGRSAAATLRCRKRWCSRRSHARSRSSCVRVLRAKRAYIERAASSGEREDSSGTAKSTRCSATGHRHRRAPAAPGERRDARSSAAPACFRSSAFEPNTAIPAVSVRRDERGLVVTDEHMRTSEPSMFAIGALRAGYSGDLTGAAGEAALAAGRSIESSRTEAWRAPRDRHGPCVPRVRVECSARHASLRRAGAAGFTTDAPRAIARDHLSRSRG